MHLNTSWVEELSCVRKLHDWELGNSIPAFLDRSIGMILGIDASNIRTGGGVTHLRELLTVADPPSHGIGKVIVWGRKETLAHLPDRAWLEKTHEKMLDGGIISRLAWQRYKLPRLARKRCDLLFVPGGNFHGEFRPFVGMSQNLLPFSPSECRRYGIAWKRFRLFLLFKGQSATFRRADGVVFLTATAQKCVESAIGRLSNMVAIIPHGIGDIFRQEPRTQLSIDDFSKARPFRWLYVSVIEFYKHQTHVAEAIAMLRNEGMPVTLKLVGPAYPQALKCLKRTLLKIDPACEFVQYLGPAQYDQLAQHYREADGFVFASSCENMPIILLEAMAAGLPIACSSVPPMPEVLGKAGVYFNPENSSEIAAVLRSLMRDSKKREILASQSYGRARDFTWQRCACDTFSFLSSVALHSRCAGGKNK